MNIETKLQRFSEVVRKEAEAENSLKLSELEKKYETSVSEYEKKAIRKYEEMTDDVVIRAEKLKQKRISEANAEVKKTLIQKRSEYIQNVFDNVLKRLDDFFQTAEYEQLIVDCIESNKGINGDITVQIMERDKALLESIVRRCGVNVVTVNEDFIGGVKIILDQNRIADFTMRSKFDAEKARFNKIKIL